jgi:polar amino acid transport system substrate-binding protein
VNFGTQTDAVQAVMAGATPTSPATPSSIRGRQCRSCSFYHTDRLVGRQPPAQGPKELLGQIENAVECMKKDGTIAGMHEKWFGTKPAPGSAAVTIFPGTGVPGMPGYDATPREPTCG